MCSSIREKRKDTLIAIHAGAHRDDLGCRKRHRCYVVYLCRPASAEKERKGIY